MKFRFCGELDCPDWVLAEIATLSKITSIKMKMLCIHVVKSILGESIDFDKIKGLTADAKYDLGDIKASIAALTYIYQSATKHAVEEEVLANELQQLGLPRESTLSLCRVFSDKYQLLHEHLKKQSMKFTEVEEVHWRTDYVLFSSNVHQLEVNNPSVVIGLKVKEPLQSVTSKTYQFTMSYSKALLMLNELRQLHARMQELT